MKEKAVIELKDDIGNDLLADKGITNLMREMTDKLVIGIHKKRAEVIKARMKSAVGIDIDFEEEQERRFKRFAIEFNGDEETIYFNDGTVRGKRIVTFVKKQNPFKYDKGTVKISVEYSYY